MSWMWICPASRKMRFKWSLENGYLTISAAKGLDKDEKDKKGRYIRQRALRRCPSRSFYVGEGFTVDDMHAKFEDGILQISVPKQPQRAIPETTYIAIE